jgi:hypothetical protein
MPRNAFVDQVTRYCIQCAERIFGIVCDSFGEESPGHVGPQRAQENREGSKVDEIKH